WPGGGAAPRKRWLPPSLRRVIAPAGSFPLAGSPALASSEVTFAGRLRTAQCQKPLAVGASGSNTVTAKLFVSLGKPDQESCGERSSPPSTPKSPERCAGGGVSPSLTSVLVTLNPGTSGRKS